VTTARAVPTTRDEELEGDDAFERESFRRAVQSPVESVTPSAVGLLAVVVLVGGAAVRNAVGFGTEIGAAWRLVRWPLGLVLVVASVALPLEIAPRRREPEASWLAVGAGVAATRWLAFMGLLVAYFELTGSFGDTYGPLAGTIGLLLWTFLTSVALFLGVASAAQLEAVRASVPEPRVERDETVPERVRA
jgi:uncharacterized BrkB/YihY/UPF0761 family membrane protein